MSVSLDAYKRLRVLDINVFPKQCGSCENIYKSLKGFLKNTHKLAQGSGLTEHRIRVGSVIHEVVHLYRNCFCGSTLLVPCKSRRDTSDLGLKRKELFLQIWNQMKSNRLDNPTTRKELRKVARGQSSKFLSSLGVDYTELHTVGSVLLLQATSRQSHGGQSSPSYSEAYSLIAKTT